jgi:hypothetical protein
MKAQMSLLSLAIASGLALAAIPAEAAGNLKSAAISRANVLLGANGTGIIRGAKGDVFAARDAIVDADGTEHVRFERSYRGLPVIGGDFVMHSRNGQLRNVSQSLKSAARPEPGRPVRQRRSDRRGGRPLRQQVLRRADLAHGGVRPRRQPRACP